MDGGLAALPAARDEEVRSSGGASIATGACWFPRLLNVMLSEGQAS